MAPVTTPTSEDLIPEIVASPPTPPRSSRAATWLAGAAVVLGVAVLVVQLITLQAARDARSEAEAAGANAVAAAGRVGELQAELDGLTGAVDELEQGIEVARLGDAIAAGEATSATETDGLPAFPSSGPDPAVQSGLRLSGLTGDEYYSGERVIYAPDGENATVWLVWAHWCPHCQNDLPALATFLEESGADYPHVQVVTITTSIDDTRGNPLVPYLDASQFPFPVLVDPDGSLATSLGTPAFPFWVVTGPDGQVLLRRPGEFGPDQLPNLFDSIEEFVAG